MKKNNKINLHENMTDSTISFWNEEKEVVNIDLKTGDIRTSLSSYNEAGRKAGEIFWVSFKDQLMDLIKGEVNSNITE